MKTLKEKATSHNTDDHIITISWAGQGNDWWNEACIEVIEVFGLPGERFRWCPTPEYMEFIFNSKKDADLCRILLSHRL